MTSHENKNQRFAVNGDSMKTRAWNLFTKYDYRRWEHSSAKLVALWDIISDDFLIVEELITFCALYIDLDDEIDSWYQQISENVMNYL